VFRKSAENNAIKHRDIENFCSRSLILCPTFHQSWFIITLHTSLLQVSSFYYLRCSALPIRVTSVTGHIHYHAAYIPASSIVILLSKTQRTAHKGYQCHRSHSLYVISDISSEYLSVLKFPYQPPIQKLPPSPPVTLKFPAESIMGYWNLKRFREKTFQRRTKVLPKE
jgi:hypothetical protein